MDLSPLEYISLSHVIKRGTGRILEEDNNACLLCDTVSGVLFLACEDKEKGIAMLDRHTNELGVLMLSNPEIGKVAFSRYGFVNQMECYQVAYYGQKPPLDERLTLRVATLDDFPIIAEHYHMTSKQELREIIGRGLILLGYHEGQLVGFIGEHLEGSMGLLHVFPEYRRMGFGFSLEKAKIADVMQKGFIPFAQIEKNNLPSLRLQEKLGMTRSKHTILWFWKVQE